MSKTSVTLIFCLLLRKSKHLLMILCSLDFTHIRNPQMLDMALGYKLKTLIAISYYLSRLLGSTNENSESSSLNASFNNNTIQEDEEVFLFDLPPPLNLSHATINTTSRLNSKIQQTDLMRTGKFSSTREQWGRRSFTSDTFMFEPSSPSSPLQPRRHSYAANEHNTVRTIPLLQSHDEALQYVAKYAQRSAKDLSKELGGGTGSGSGSSESVVERENDAKTTSQTTQNNNNNSNSNNNNNNNNNTNNSNNNNNHNSTNKDDVSTAKEVSEVEKTRNDVDKMLLNCQNIDKINNSLTADSSVPNTPSSSSTSLNKMCESNKRDSQSNDIEDNKRRSQSSETERNNNSQSSDNDENRRPQSSSSNDENENETSLAVPDIEIEESADKDNNGNSETTIPTDDENVEEAIEESSTNIDLDIVRSGNETTLTGERDDSSKIESYGINGTDFPQSEQQQILNVQEDAESEVLRSPRNSEYGTPPLTPSQETSANITTDSINEYTTTDIKNTMTECQISAKSIETGEPIADSNSKRNAGSAENTITKNDEHDKEDGTNRDVEIKKHSLEVELPASPFTFSLLQRRAKTPDPSGGDGGSQDQDKKKERRRSSYLEKRQSHAGLFSLTKSTSLTQLNKSASLSSLNSLLLPPLSLAIHNPATSTSSSPTANMSELSPGQISIPEGEDESGASLEEQNEFGAPSSPVDIQLLEEQADVESSNTLLLEDKNISQNGQQITEVQRQSTGIDIENGML